MTKLSDEERRERQRAAWRKYSRSAKGKARQKRYNASDKGKAAIDRYKSSPKGKAKRRVNQKKQRATPAWKEKNRNGSALRRARERQVPREIAWNAPVVPVLVRRDGPDCFYCGLAPGTTFDHVVPIKRGGGHVWSNLVLACKPCNCQKQSSLLIDWLNRRAAAGLPITQRAWDLASGKVGFEPPQQSLF